MFDSKWFLLPVLVLAALAWLLLAGDSLQGQEVGAPEFALGAGQRVLWIQQLVVERQAPLTVVFERLLLPRLAPGALGMRLPSLLLGLISIGLIYVLGLRLLNRRVALIASFLLALSPASLWYTQEAGAALLPMTLALAASVSFYRLADGGRFWRSGLLYLLCALGLSFAHAYGIGFVLCFGLLARMSRMPGERAVHGMGALSVLAWCLYRWGWLAGESLALSGAGLGSLATWDWRGIFLGWLGSGRALAPLLMEDVSSSLLGGLHPWLALASQVLLLILVVRGLGTLLRTQHLGRTKPHSGSERIQASAHLILLVLLLPLVLWIVSQLGGPVAVQGRDLLPVLPFFLLLIATGLAVGVTQKRQAWVALGMGLFLKLDLLFVLGQPGAWMVDEPRADWAAAASFLGAELDAGSEARELYLAFDEGFALVHYEPRLQLKNWRQRLAKLSEDMSPGGTLAGPAEAQLVSLDELELAWEEAWDARRMGVLALSADPLRSSGPSRAERLPFYLLFKQHAGQGYYRMEPLLLPPILEDLDLEIQPIGDPTLDSPLASAALLRIEEEHHFDSLVLLKMNWVH